MLHLRNNSMMAGPFVYGFVQIDIRIKNACMVSEKLVYHMMLKQHTAGPYKQDARNGQSEHVAL